MVDKRIPEEYYPDNGMEDLTEIEPVHILQDGYEQEYSYSAIHTEAMDLPKGVAGRTYFEGELGVWSTFKKGPPVLLTDDRVLTHKDAYMKQARNQAYFTLSILASEGLVSNFTKR